MPLRIKILEELNAGSGPMAPKEIAERVGAKRPSVVKQLDRLFKDDRAVTNNDGLYSINDAGKSILANASPSGEGNEGEGDDGEGDGNEGSGDGNKKESFVSEEEAKATEYQRFLTLGKKVGVPLNLVQITTEHVWNGGDWKDLQWVQKAHAEMGIRGDLAMRWLNSWRSYLQTHGISVINAPAPKLEADNKTISGSGQASGRDYILDGDDKPIFVGEGLGDMSRSEAMDLARIRGSRGRSTAGGAGGGQLSPVEMLSQLITAIQGLDSFRSAGASTPRPSYIMKPKEDGSWEAEEIQEGKPMIVGAPSTQAPKKTFLVNPAGEVQEVEAGRPIIIKQMGNNGGAPAQPVEHYMVDKATGIVEKLNPGQPIIIVQQPSPQQPSPQQSTPIQLMGADGKPIVMDLNTYIHLEEFKGEEHRKEESHKTKQEIAMAFKELLKKASTAAEHMIENRGTDTKVADKKAKTDE